MELLTLIHVSFVMLGLFLGVATSILVGHVWRDMRRVRDTRRLPEDEKRAFKFLETGDPALPEAMAKTDALRDHLVKLARGLSGDLATKLMMLYTTLGYTKADFRAMARGRRRARLQALERCRALNIPLPEEAWSILLRDPLPTARWVVMEYLVATKGKTALPWVLRFLVEETASGAARKGVLVHVVACLAQHTPETLPLLLDHVDRDDLRETLLLVLARYPTAGAEGAINRSLRLNADDALLVAGVRALASHPSSHSLRGVSILADHPSAIVRQTVAEGLRSFADPEAAGILSQLAVDSSHEVRHATITSLLALDAHDELAEIDRDSAHPAHPLLRRHRASHARTSGAAA